MKCKYCHEEMKEGKLYCENCGRPVQIVPNFEPEIEAKMDETLSAIAVDDVLFETKEHSPKKETHIPFWVIVTAVTFAVVVAVFFYAANHTYGAYYEKGMQAIENGNYDQALLSFQNALLRDENSVDARLQVAYTYRKKGEDKKALDSYLQLIEKVPDCVDAYAGAIELYEEQEDFLSINKLLNACTDDTVYEQFKEYLSLPPEFSEKEGIYHERLMLRLMTDNKGTIYYTLDGSEPGKESLVYKAPIALNPGKNVVRAVFVNEMGIVSDSVSKIYEIELMKPEEPIVTPAEGEYGLPEYVSVTIPDDCEVYYTTDGTEPTNQSEKYEGPIPMPLGASRFKFVAYSGNKIYSPVVTRMYQLTFEGACTAEVAANYVAATLAGKGKMLDADGNIAGKSGQYKYRCTSAVREGNYFYYMVEEYYLPENGESEKTGDLYAVNAFDFTICTVHRNTEGKLVFQFL